MKARERSDPICLIDILWATNDLRLRREVFLIKQMEMNNRKKYRTRHDRKILPDLIDHSTKFQREKPMMWVMCVEMLTKAIDLHEG